MVINVTTIGTRAFDACDHLTSITIPDSVTIIDNEAFVNCTFLENITILNGVKEIGYLAFGYCGNLNTIVIGENVERIDPEAFAPVPYFGHTHADVYTVKGCVADQFFTSIDYGGERTFTVHYLCDPTEHQYGDWVITKEATCTEVGNKEKICVNCMDKITETIPAKGHVWEKEYKIDKEATCTEEGSESIHCAVCGEADESTIRVIPKTGHKFGDWVITKEAACADRGSRERTCTICGEKETEVIPAPGHTWAKDYTVDKEPTQTEDGSESIHCTVCGAIDKSSVRVIPKLGFSVDAEFVLEKSDFNYTGKPITPGVTVTYNGKQLVRDKDFKVTYGNNIDLGQADVDVTGIGNYTGTEHLHFTIRLSAPMKVTCTNVASGMKVSWTKVRGATSYKVYRNGKHIFTTSALEVTDKEVKYKGGTKYVYKVIATENRFGDSKLFRTSTCYRLLPVGIKSLTNPSAGKMTVTYDKSEGCYGYVVRYGLKADMSDAKVVTVQGQNTTSRTFGNMKKGKTYFVQVRSYKLDNGVRYYSGYCTTKMIKITK